MPIIAIAPCDKLHDYEESVRRAGGEVRVLDPGRDTPESVIGSVDALLLPGGNDVLPSLYGEAADPSFEPAEPGRDEYELELARRASDADLPLLAICRGVQVLNVARGGSLHQDITHPTVKVSRVSIAHDIWITAGSMLDRLLKDREDGDVCPVNSRHHQALKNIGKGLVVTATAPDGIVEAVEDPSKRFCVGVQWHPENFYRTGEFRSLFEGLIAAAAARR
jgi:putative glutamine amidotransferase